MANDWIIYCGGVQILSLPAWIPCDREVLVIKLNSIMNTVMQYHAMCIEY